MNIKNKVKRIGGLALTLSMMTSLVVPYNITAIAAKNPTISKKSAVVYVGSSIKLRLKNTNKKAKIKWTVFSGKYALFAVRKKPTNILEITGAKPGKFKVTAIYILGNYQKKFSCKVTVKNKKDKHKKSDNTNVVANVVTPSNKTNQIVLVITFA